MLSRRLLVSSSSSMKRALPPLGPSNAQPSLTTATSAVRRTSTKPIAAPEPQSDPSAPAMLRYEPFLPHLPVPPLSHTLPLYLSSLSPHLTPDELAASKRAVDRFAASDLAKVLQERLEKRAGDEGRESWLAEWWDEVAYMSYRDPVVPFVNYFYTHKGTGGPGKTQTRRAAELIRATDVFRDLVESKQLEPERVRSTPLAMASYKNLFNASRIPAIPSDLPKKYPTAKGQNDHVVVLRKNRFFAVRVGGLGADEIERILREIVDEVGDVASEEHVGVLTSANRDDWTKAREHLLSLSPANKDALETIEAASVLVALDDSEPFTVADEVEGDRERRLVELSWRLWVGEQASNRWFDKHQFIVTPSAHSGFNGEHSMLDGTPTLRMNEFVLASLAQNRIELEPAAARPDAAPTGGKARELKWVVDDRVRHDVDQARRAHVKLMGDHQMEALHFTGYGKDLIKKYKTSPDAWAQLVKHLAFFKMEDRMGVCYESAQTRKFKLGRTEVIRSASQEAKDWILSMLDPFASDADRVALFRKACERHLKYAALAADGRGVDRHLFGLRMLLEEGEPKPDIFTDPAFAKTSHWEMSTSSLVSDYLDGWGYGEVVEDGYGLAYSVGDHYLRWVITARKGKKAKELKQCLQWACDEVRGMMERAEREAAVGGGGAGEGKAKL